MRTPAGPIRSAISRAWAAAADRAVDRYLPGAWVEQIDQLARQHRDVRPWSCQAVSPRLAAMSGIAGQDLFEVLGVALAIPHFQALSGTRHHDLLAEAGVGHQERGDHHAVGGVELGIS